MPTSVMVSFRLLFVFLLSCAVCLNAQFINPLVDFNGTIPQNGQVLVIPQQFDVTGYPGPTRFTITAGYSVNLCVTPYAAVTFNLSQNCPNNNLLTFTYNDSAVDPFQLFLNDYSFSFRGSRNNFVVTNNDAPWTPISRNFTLLQNLPYFMSIEFADDSQKNSTETRFRLIVTPTKEKCPNGQVPSNTPGQNECITINGIISPQNKNTSRTIVTVSRAKPQLIQIAIGLDGLIVPSFEMNLFAPAGVEDLLILLAYNAFPNAATQQYTLQTPNTRPNPYAGEITSFAQNFTSPLPGIYYAWMTTNTTTPRDIEITITQNNCSISETDTSTNSQCGGLTYQVLSIETLELAFTNETMYFAVVDALNLELGALLSNTSSSFNAEIGFNFFPTSSVPSGLSPQYSSRNGQLFFSLNASQPTTFIVALNGLPGETYTIWQGTQCPYNNCNGHGTCNPDLTCTCDGYNGPFCQNKNKKLSTLYIILIIIGGAIVLAVLIGVPVALYLNNRKRARYERV